MVYAGVNGAPTHFGETRMNAFGPRLGVAYQLNSKTVIRAGGAIYYQPPREDGNADNGIQGFGGTYGATGNFLSNGISFLTKNGLTAFTSQIQNLKPPISDPQTLTGNLFQQSPFFYFSKTGRSAYFSDWQISIERTLTNDSVFRATYHGVVGNKLISRQQSSISSTRDIGAFMAASWVTRSVRYSTTPSVIAAGFKLPYPSYPTNLQLQQALRPFPQFSGIDSNASGLNDGHSTYHALETSFEHRFANGLYLTATYTFCKLISTSNGEDANRDTLGAVQNQYNRRLDKSVAYNEDTPHNIHVGYIYDLPVGKGKALLSTMPKVANAVFGNWRVSAIHTYVSGTPLWISCGQNFFGAGSNARCSFAPGATTGQIPLINPAWNWSHDNIGTTALGRIPYLNPAAFILPANMTYGDTPRQMSYLAQAVDRQRRRRDPEELRDPRKGQPGTPRVGVQRSEPGLVWRAEHDPEQRRLRQDHRAGNSRASVQFGARVSF